MKTTVRDILKGKGNDVWSIGPEATVLEALELMADKDVGALVVQEAGKVIGLISERDYARKLALKGRSSRETPVREIMTTRILGVSPAQTVDDCMALITDKHVRHLPVMDDNELIGLVSIGDLVKSVIADQQFVIKQLESYISG